MDLTTQAKQLDLDFDGMNDITVNLGDYSDTITLSSGASTTYTWDSSYGAIPPNNFSNVSIDPSIWSNTGPSWTITESDLISPNSGKISLTGENADIEINGRSLTAVLDSIEQRLGLLKCREDLESEWEDLKALGDQYRELVRQIEEKTKMWDTLKKMPPPEIL